MKKLLKKLSKRLTPETDRQPVISAQSWQVHWQQDLAADDTECIGVLLKIGKRLYWRVLDGDEMLYWPSDDRQLLATLLDALTFRFAAGDATPPLGILLNHQRESTGDTISEILTYLWKHGPALTLRKKKVRYPHDEREIADHLVADAVATHYHDEGGSTHHQHDAEQLPEKYSD